MCSNYYGGKYIAEPSRQCKHKVTSLADISIVILVKIIHKGASHLAFQIFVVDRYK